MAYNLSAARFSISDGVSQSYMSGIWADLLVSNYVNSSLSSGTEYYDSLKGQIKKLGEQWEEKTKIIEESANEISKKRLESSRKDHPYAAATFAGITINSDKIFYDVLGDSCIFIINRDSDIKVLSTISKDGMFDPYPDYITSKATLRGKWHSGVETIREGFVFMMTDALSEWFINLLKEDHLFAQKLWHIHSHAEFEYLLLKERNRIIEKEKRFALKDDDCALIMLKIPKNHVGIEILHHDDINCFIAAEEESAILNSYPLAEISNHINFQLPDTNKTLLLLPQKGSNIRPLPPNPFILKQLCVRVWKKIISYIIFPK